MQKVNRKSGRVQNSADSNDRPTILMAARISKSFHDRVEAECARRDLSLQKLVTSAVAAYIAQPPDQEPPDPRNNDRGVPAHLLSLGWSQPGDVRLRLWSTYLDKMPDEKIDIMVSAMKWDLRMRKSARRK